MVGDICSESKQLADMSHPDCVNLRLNVRDNILNMHKIVTEKNKEKSFIGRGNKLFIY